jgi:hypothetical protein
MYAQLKVDVTMIIFVFVILHTHFGPSLTQFLALPLVRGFILSATDMIHSHLVGCAFV